MEKATNDGRHNCEDIKKQTPAAEATGKFNRFEVGLSVQDLGLSVESMQNDLFQSRNLN